MQVSFKGVCGKYLQMTLKLKGDPRQETDLYFGLSPFAQSVRSIPTEMDYNNSKLLRMSWYYCNNGLYLNLYQIEHPQCQFQEKAVIFYSVHTVNKPETKT